MNSKYLTSITIICLAIATAILYKPEINPPQPIKEINYDFSDKIVIDENTPKIILNIYGREITFWKINYKGRQYIVNMSTFGCYVLTPLD